MFFTGLLFLAVALTVLGLPAFLVSMIVYRHQFRRHQPRPWLWGVVAFLLSYAVSLGVVILLIKYYQPFSR